MGAAGCSGPPNDGQVTVLAASSTAPVLEPAARIFEERTGIEVVLDLGSSAAHARRITEGAPADLFVCADPLWTQQLAGPDGGGVAARLALATGDLVLVAPAGRGFQVTIGPSTSEPSLALPDVLPGRFASGDPDSVPLGRYARRALRSLGWWEALEPRLVGTLDARAAVALVQRGEVSAGIVYASDARAPGLELLGTFPPDPDGIRYEGVVPLGGSEGGRAFLRFLAGPEGQALFREAGFVPVAPAAARAPAVIDPGARGQGGAGRAVLLSLKVSTVAALLDLPLALLVAWVLARRRFRGKLLVEALVTLPLVLPPVVTGYLLLVALGSRSWLGGVMESLGFSPSFDWKGAALAAAVVGFPLMVRTMQASFEGLDRRLEEAARTLGASRRGVFWRVSLPLALPGVLAGFLLGYARALGEFGATITFVGNVQGRTRTLPLEIFTRTLHPGSESELGWLVALSAALAVAAVLAGELLNRALRRRWPV